MKKGHVPMWAFKGVVCCIAPLARPFGMGLAQGTYYVCAHGQGNSRQVERASCSGGCEELALNCWLRGCWGCQEALWRG